MEIKDKILTALVQGPVATSRWAEFSKSRKSFHIHIHHLREKGYAIETEDIWPGLSADKQYVLSENANPVCRCCGQPLKGVE